MNNSYESNSLEEPIESSSSSDIENPTIKETESSENKKIEVAEKDKEKFFKLASCITNSKMGKCDVGYLMERTLLTRSEIKTMAKKYLDNVSPHGKEAFYVVKSNVIRPQPPAPEEPPLEPGWSTQDELDFLRNVNTKEKD